MGKIMHFYLVLLLYCLLTLGIRASDDSWIFYGDFEHVYTNRDVDLNRYFKAEPKYKRYIKNISCSGYKNGGIKLNIYLVDKNFSEFKRTYPNFNQELKNVGKKLLPKHWLEAYPNHEAAFLQLFYKYNLIPDPVVSRLLKEMKLEDFRLNGARFLERIEQERIGDRSAEHFYTLVLEELDHIKGSRRQTEILWYIIQRLQQQSPVNQKLILELCNRIQDPSLPCYEAAQTLIANLNFSEENKGLKPAPLLRESAPQPYDNSLETGSLLSSMPAVNSPIPIFVLGPPRSGTTLMGKYIGSCKKVCNLIEYPGFYIASKIGPSFQRKVKVEYKADLYKAFFDRATVFAADQVRHEGREAYVDSNPFNFEIIKDLQREIKPAIFIIMLRDYRGVISSLERSYKAGYLWAGKNDGERAKLYHRFYRYLKEVDNLEDVIFLNYDHLCKNPNEILNEFEQQFYEKLKTLFKVQNPEKEWEFNRQILCESHAPTYSTSMSNTGSSLLRAFSGSENDDGTFTLNSINSYNMDDWGLERDMIVAKSVGKIINDLNESHSVGNIMQGNPAFATFYKTLQSLRERYESKSKVLASNHQTHANRTWRVPSSIGNFIDKEMCLEDLHICLQRQAIYSTFSAVTELWPGL
jgi:Sulfotransferase family